jgi:hypothetical protein
MPDVACYFSPQSGLAYRWHDRLSRPSKLTALS